MASKRIAEFMPAHDSHVKKSRKSLTIEVKMDVIRRMESGDKRSDVCKALNLAPSTVTTIMNNAKKIKQSHRGLVNLRSPKTTYSRSEIMEKMEELLVMWIDDANHHSIPVTQAAIMDKARCLFNEISEELGGDESFSASRGWFFRFKNRTRFHNVKIEDDADVVSSDSVGVDEYPSVFQKLMEEGSYTPDSVFNVAEIGLYWKKMPSRTYMASEEGPDSGFNNAKDRLVLLLGGNASGTFKLKPMLVYHSENPPVMKGIVKTRLPVFWSSNKKACVTQTLFSEWYTSYFCPEVAQFCAANNLPNNAVLVLDNAPGHPSNLEDIPNDFLNVKVVYLPPYTTSLQPMDQGVIQTFQACYLRTTFKGIVEAVQASDSLTVMDYWRSYNILKAISNIAATWKEVPQSCLNGSWRRLWPEVVPYFLDFDDISAMIEDVIRMAEDVGLDNIDIDDVNELLQSHNEPLSKEDIKELTAQLVKQNSEEDVEEQEIVPIRALATKTLQSALSQIQTGCETLCDNDPDWERSSSIQRAVTNILKPYYSMLEERNRNTHHMSLLQLFPKLNEPAEPNNQPSDESY